MSSDTWEWGAAFVRVTGVRRDRFVEFDFSIGEIRDADTDLAVEMILPYPAFREFCAERHVELLPTSEEAALAYLALQEKYEDAHTKERGGCLP